MNAEDKMSKALIKLFIAAIVAVIFFGFIIATLFKVWF